MLPSYRVLRAFREPREGGNTVPYRYYEVGTTVTIDDFKAWQIGAAIEGEKHRLIQEGYLIEIVPGDAPGGEKAPAVGDISDITEMWTREKAS